MAVEWLMARLEKLSGDEKTAYLKVHRGNRDWPEFDKPFLVRIRHPRNKKVNRLYWKMLREVVDGTDRWATPEVLHDWLKEVLGLTYRVGGTRIIGSTDFEAMDEAQFRDFFERATVAICMETGIDPLEFTEVQT